MSCLWCTWTETPPLILCAGNSPVTGEFPAQRPVTRSFDVFFDLRQNKCLSKQWWGWWFESPSRPLWRHCNDTRYPSCTWCQGCNKSDNSPVHYSDVIMARWRLKSPASRFFYSTAYSGADQRNIRAPRHWPLCGDRWPVNSPHKWPVTRKMFPFDDVIIFPCEQNTWHIESSRILQP